MMDGSDVAATKLDQTGSRRHYQILAAGESKGRGRVLKRHGRAAPARGQRIENLDNARHEIRASLDRDQSSGSPRVSAAIREVWRSRFRHAGRRAEFAGLRGHA